MRNFSINLLGTVQTVIGKQPYTVERWLSRSPNASGKLLDVYSAPESRTGSVQPVDRSKYEVFGLDLSAIWIQIWDINIVEALKRGSNGDIITFNGERYKVDPEKRMDWNNQGGWNSVMARRIEN